MKKRILHLYSNLLCFTSSYSRLKGVISVLARDYQVDSAFAIVPNVDQSISAEFRSEFLDEKVFWEKAYDGLIIEGHPHPQPDLFRISPEIAKRFHESGGVTLHTVNVNDLNVGGIRSLNTFLHPFFLGLDTFQHEEDDIVGFDDTTRFGCVKEFVVETNLEYKYERTRFPELLQGVSRLAVADPLHQKIDLACRTVLMGNRTTRLLSRGDFIIDDRYLEFCRINELGGFYILLSADLLEDRIVNRMASDNLLFAKNLAAHFMVLQRDRKRRQMGGVSKVADLAEATTVGEDNTNMGESSNRVDVAILTVLPEEYRAVCEKLEDLQNAQSRSDHPNLYAWKTGKVRSEYGNYTVAVGMMGRAGTIESALATEDSVVRWNPRCVFFVGIAGGLKNVCVGDVVIADVIHGYEYGKLEKKFAPRSSWTYRTDIGLLTSALALSSSNWRLRITAKPPMLIQPKVVPGEIASGDKVVDDPSNEFFRVVVDAWPKILAVEMEGAGAGNAIEHVHSRGNQVSFMMVRGISDLPRPPEGEAGSDEARGTQERDTWKVYAADAAAAFAVSLIAAGLPCPPR